MARLLEIGGTNAVFATLLAVLAWAIARHWRQPAFVHFLWVIVLVKLITPQLVAIPWRVATDGAATNLQIAAVVIDSVAERATKQIAAARFAAAQGDKDVSDVVAVASRPPNATFAEIPWTTCIGCLWLAGSAIWLAIAVGRLARFHFALADASAPSAELQRLADDVSAKVGVHRYRIRVTTARLSPLVWPIGRPTVVVPQNLLDVLTEPELKAIVTHEFAHLRRKDHWVRWLELVVTAIYWWHPVVWYVRRKIQQAEESACDAWVVRSQPATATAYANALFQAVECATGAFQPAPVLVSRVTSGGDLKERIEHVINATWNAEMSTSDRWGLWFAALCILPVSLTMAYANDAATAPSEEDTAAVPAEPAQVAAPPQPGNVSKNVPQRRIVEPEIDDASVLRDQVNFLNEQFKRTDALYRTGALGGTVDRWAMTGYELARARGELALVEGHRADAVARFAEAEEFAGTLLKATSAAYHADRVTLDSLMQASNNLTDIRRRLILVRRAPAAATNGHTLDDVEADLRSVLSVRSSSESSTPSLAYLRKMISLQKDRLARLQPLVDKQLISTSELTQVKSELELGVASLRQAEHVLESHRLLVQLAEVEYAQAVEANKSVPGAASELEVRRKKLMVDLARAKVREIEE